MYFERGAYAPTCTYVALPLQARGPLHQCLLRDCFYSNKWINWEEIKHSKELKDVEKISSDWSSHINV